MTWAVVGLAKSLALSMAADNIRVNVVCPGLADTPMKVGFTGRSGDPAEAAANEAKIVAAVPMGRLVGPGDVADAVLWLVSDEASFVTGVTLPDANPFDIDPEKISGIEVLRTIIDGDQGFGGDELS